MKLISNVSINKQLKNFQNCFSVLFWLCQVEGLREVFFFFFLIKNVSAGKILSATYGLSMPSLEDRYKPTLCYFQITVLIFTIVKNLHIIWIAT